MIYRITYKKRTIYEKQLNAHAFYLIARLQDDAEMDEVCSIGVVIYNRIKCSWKRKKGGGGGGGLRRSYIF